MSNPVVRFFRRVLCDHRFEVDAQVFGTRARVRWCPVCLRTSWVD